MKKVIGVDFGTARSYFCACPEDEVHPQELRFGNRGNGGSGLATAILYRKSDPDSLLFGDVAFEEWMEICSGNGGDNVLRTHFKPDIATNPEAREYAKTFLKAAREQVRKIHPEDNTDFVFGFPCEADSTFRDSLQEITREAGYGDVILKPEPEGALWFHLNQKDIDFNQASEGVLVVDFGGGTCDFAYMSDFRDKKGWGDMQYGGRLFDDLFFRWFQEQNPDKLQTIRAKNDEYFVQWYLCREAKEHFSRTMEQNRRCPATKKIGSYGSLTDMKWEDFLSRAQKYQPTEQFRDMLRQCGEQTPQLLCEKPIDLLKWFQELLEDGLREHDLHPSSVKQVILTGGSSQWPFVRDIVCEVLRLDCSCVRRSPNPNSAIGEGLAIHHAVSRDFERRARNLRKDLSKFITKTISSLADGWVRNSVDELCDELDAHYDNVKKSVGDDSNAEDATVSRIESCLKEKWEGFKSRDLPAIEARLNEESEKALRYKINREVQKWFESEGIRYGSYVTKVKVPRINIEPPQQLSASNPWRWALGATAIVVIVITLLGAGIIGIFAVAFSVWLLWTLDAKSRDWHLPEWLSRISRMQLKRATERQQSRFRSRTDSQLKAMVRETASKLRHEIETRLEQIETICKNTAR